jgi:hypothetical protein
MSILVSSASDKARERRCLNWHYLDNARHHIPHCRRWNCAVHGWSVRRAWADEVLAQLPEGRDSFTIIFHLNGRVSGKLVGPASISVRDACRREVPGSLSLVFVHVSGAAGRLRPYPHLHVLLLALPGTADNDALQTIRRNVTSTLRLRFPSVVVKDWWRHDNPAAAVVYGFMAREKDKRLPLSKLPRSGDGYRLHYPRRGAKL